MARKVIGPAIHGMTRKLFPQRMVPASKLPPLAVAGRREYRDRTYKYLSCYANEKGLEVHVIEEMKGLASLPEFEDYAPLEVICPWHEARERIQNCRCFVKIILISNEILSHAWSKSSCFRNLHILYSEYSTYQTLPSVISFNYGKKFDNKLKKNTGCVRCFFLLSKTLIFSVHIFCSHRKN